MPTFYRYSFTEVWITLSSNEILGVLDSDYIEDYFGNDGQISVLHEDGDRFTVLMNELPDETPGIPHDVFTGYLELDSIPNGTYTIQGRVKDVLGNYTILGEVENPLGTERVINLEFDVADGGSQVTVVIGPVKLMGGVAIEFETGHGLQASPEVLIPLQPETSMLLGFISEVALNASPQPDVLITTLLQPEPSFTTELLGDVT